MIAYENQETNKAINSIYKALQSRIIKSYNIDDVEEAEEIAEELLKIHGMNRERFSVIKQVEDLFSNNLSDISVDDNANRGEKTIKAILAETSYPFYKIIGYRFLYHQMIELYGKKEAKYLSSLMYDYTLAISDSTSMLNPYCWSFDASKLVTMGKPFGQLPSKPTKRIDSYISLLNEVVHQMSNSLAGAVAVGTFFIDIGHLLLLKENKTIDDLYDKQYRKYIKNQFQRLVHGFNSLSRSGGSESPFTNISLFDREKLKKLVEEEYQWYFYPVEHSHKKYSNEEIIEFIVELQNIFMEFFDEGDPCNNGMPYRFPISTLNISRKKDKENKWIIEDKKFLKSVCKKDIYRYNLFVSEGNKVASCCRLLNDQDKIDLASQANSFGAGGSISLGSHRVVTINFMRLALLSKTKEDFKYQIKKMVVNCKKILYAHKELLRESTKDQIFLKEGWIQLDRMFSTIGLMGYVEAQEYLKEQKIYTKQENVINDILEILEKILKENNEEYKKCFFNVEQIPGESMSHRLCDSDKLLFGDKVKYNIYSNQFIPVWDKSKTLWDKMKIDGEYISKLSGGGISWINTGEHITGLQTEKLINYAIECNLEHFAINGMFCKCSNGHVNIGDTKLCIECGEKIIDKITRTVGFFINVKDASTKKQKYDFAIRREYKNGDFEILV